MSKPRDPLFEEAFKVADILALVEAQGVKLYPAGREMRGACPLCGASEKKRADGAFAVVTKSKIWTCHSCEEGGDVIALEHELRGGTLREAAARLLKVDLADWDRRQRELDDSYAPVQGFSAPAKVRPERNPRRVEKDAEDARAEAWKAETAARLWREGMRAWSTPLETYLRRRVPIETPLAEHLLGQVLGQLRFHPRAYHSGPSARPVEAPAMIGLVMTPEGPTGGAHVTYLAAGGMGKADLSPAKRMWGDQILNGRPGGVWLTRPDADGPLIVGEGIESVLSAAILMGRPCRMVAALSLRGLQGGWAHDRWGRYDVEAPTADPEKPAFTWPAPAGCSAEVMIAVDRDMAPIKVKVRKAQGGTWRRPLTADERARVCGGLAEQHWRAAGAHAVRIIAPGPGRDFNDEIRAQLRPDEGDL